MNSAILNDGRSPAERLLVSLGITDPSEIDIDAIALHCGARVTYRPLTGCEAQIIGFRDRALILVNSLAGRTRQRFSIAHELGHWHHHRGKSVDCRTTGDTNRSLHAQELERIADAYAADLLLPRYLVMPRLDRIGRIDVDAIRELSREFAMSFTATAIRVAEIGVTPLIVICHGAEGRKWFVSGPIIPGRWFPKETLDAASGVFECVYGTAPRAKPKRVSASLWFDHVSASGFQVREEAMRVLNGETIVILELTDDQMLRDDGRQRVSL